MQNIKTIFLNSALFIITLVCSCEHVRASDQAEELVKAATAAMS